LFKELGHKDLWGIGVWQL